MIISKRIQALEESQSFIMAARCQQMRDAGIDVIGLSLGEPDFPTPESIKQAAKEAIDNNFSYYGPVAGFASLRKAVAKTLNEELHIEMEAGQLRAYTEKDILIGVGAKQAICASVMALIGPGDEVIVPTPCWVSYSEMVKLAEGTSVFVRTDLEHEYKLTPAQLEAVITDRSKLLMLCSPNNPTGSVYTKEELQALVDVLVKHPNIYVIADEIYSKIRYTEAHATLAQFPEIENRVIAINGVSKSYAMTGYRVGWLACKNTEIIGGVKKIFSQETTCTATIAQKAAEAALMGDQTCVEKMREAFERRRNLMVELASEIEELKFHVPQGAFYLFPDVTAFYGRQATVEGKRYTINNCDELVDYLLDVAHVACVAGSAFGEPRCIRFSYATSEEKITEAMRRIREAMALLK